MASVKETASSKRQEQLAKIAGVRAHVGPAAAKFNDRQTSR